MTTGKRVPPLAQKSLSLWAAPCCKLALLSAVLLSSACSTPQAKSTLTVMDQATLAALSDAQLLQAQTDTQTARAQFERAQQIARGACYKRFAVFDCLEDLRLGQRAQADALFLQDAHLAQEQQRRRVQTQLTLIDTRKTQLAADEQEAQRVMQQQQALAAQEAPLKLAEEQADRDAAAARVAESQLRTTEAAQKLAEFEQRLREQENLATPARCV